MRGLGQFAVISDVHGNVWALDAVLADIARRGIEGMVNLGDHVFGPLDPVGAANRLIKLACPTIRGNMDREIFDNSPAVPGSTLEQNRQALKFHHRAWLASLPPTLVYDGDILLCHGTPGSDCTYLLETVSPTGATLASIEEIETRSDGRAESLIVCGHSHLPRTVLLPAGTMVVNPGSVGLPAYTQDEPYPHRMETGSPHARYAIIRRSESGWQVEHIDVVYDWQRAAEVAAQNGREDWARALVSGRAG